MKRIFSIAIALLLLTGGNVRAVPQPTDPDDAETPATQAVPYDCGSGCGTFPPQAAAAVDPFRSPE